MTTEAERDLSITVGDIAILLNAEIVGPPDCSENIIVRTGTIKRLEDGVIGFVSRKSFLADAIAAQHGVVITSPDLFASVQPETNAITWMLHPDPITAMATVQLRFHPELNGSAFDLQGDLLHSSASLGPDVQIGHGSTIGRESLIGAGAVIHADSHIMDSVTIGADTIIYPGVVIYPGTVVGAHCIIHAGTIIGADGFRFHHADDDHVIKFPQAGNVIIGDHVEIGANCTIDRATFSNESTDLDRDVKVDDQVHIGHNAKIGAGTLIAAQTCISGSVEIGELSWIGAGVTIGDNIRVGRKAQLLVNAVVATDVPPGATFSGFYAVDHGRWKRAYLKMIRRART
jgi:UDP-3-O-[3-hydroxymyristoyl] glucosamine N-acyltransferase